MTKPTNDFDYIWNDLPVEERKRLHPYFVEAHKLHIWQCKIKAIEAHRIYLRELDDTMRHIEAELNRYKEQNDK